MISALEGGARGSSMGALFGAGIACIVSVSRESMMGYEALEEDRELACCFTSSGGIMGGIWGALYAVNNATETLDSE